MRRFGERQDERGLSSSVQYAVLTPVLMLVVIGIIQVGVWFHGRNVAMQAAELAADQMRGRGADVGAAQAAAQRVTTVGGLREVSIQIDRGATQVQVSVSAAAPTLVDLRLPRIEQRAAAPVERVTRP
ncbi:MAG: TadE family protein [Propionibacteriaceae bacterium]